MKEPSARGGKGDGPRGPRTFGFKPVSGEDSNAAGEAADPEEQGPAPIGAVPPGAQNPAQTPVQADVFERAAPSLERSWILALALGFGGTLAGGLIALPAAPVLGAAVVFAPLWLRMTGGSNAPSAALAGVAWILGCVGAGAGLGAEGGGGRFVSAVPLASTYLTHLARGTAALREGSASILWSWPSLLPAALLGIAIAFGGRWAKGLGAVALAALPATWMAAQSARFTAAALGEDWDAGTALLASLPPQHFTVLAGALAIAVTSASPLRGHGLVPAARTERRVFWIGVAVALTGLVGEPLLTALWSAYGLG